MPETEILNPKKILKAVGIEYGWHVADLGCGAGFNAMQAARMVGDQGQVYAVDVLKTSLPPIETKAKLEGLTNLKTVWSNLEIVGATKIPEGTLDLALIVNVLFQSKKHKEILQESSRLIKQGGKLVIVDWKKEGSPMGPPVNDRVNLEALKATVQQAGFSLEQEIEAGPYHFGLIFLKN